MDDSFVKWATAVIALFALVVSFYNFWVGYRKNAREATFKMLDRWTADAMREARHEVIDFVVKKDKEAIDRYFDYLVKKHVKETSRSLRKERLDSRLSAASPSISQRMQPRDVEELQRKCDVDQFGFSVCSRYAEMMDRINLEEGQREYCLWYVTVFTELDQIHTPAFSEQERGHWWERAYRGYEESGHYQIDLAASADLRVAFIHVAQVMSELKSLFDVGVVDQRLTKTLFNQSLREWQGRVHRFVNSQDDTETKWIEEQVAPLPFQVEYYQPANPVTWAKATLSLLPESVRARIKRGWQRIRATLSPNSARLTAHTLTPPPQG